MSGLEASHLLLSKATATTSTSHHLALPLLLDNLKEMLLILICLISSSLSLNRESLLSLSDSNFKHNFREIDIQGAALYVRIIKNNHDQE